jgi:multimeric flavodoxin WrbA
MKGNTALILDMVKAELASDGSDVTEINLAHRDIQPCRGCRLCFDKGETSCPLADDLAEIREAMRAHDVTVFASPIYVEDVNGAMKGLIDRMAYACHRPEFYARGARLAAASARPSPA